LQLPPANQLRKFPVKFRDADIGLYTWLFYCAIAAAFKQALLPNIGKSRKIKQCERPACYKT